MNRKKIVAGNWKMNTSLTEAESLVNAIKVNSSAATEVVRMVFPPFPFLHTICDLIDGEQEFYCGAQNCSRHDKGAYTGEVSASMLRSVGATHVLVGHSERRTYFQETGTELVEKIDQALRSDLTVLFCFGEQLAERKAGKHFETVQTQLKEVLSQFPKSSLNNLILAYEPVWAIGTGETASPQQAQEMHAYVRKVVSEIFSEPMAQTISILYGGSCNAQNARELFSCADVDGGLIGGASLKADDFCKIINAF